MYWLRRVIDLVLYGHFWIAAAALAMCWQTRLLLMGQVQLSVLDGFVAGGTLTIYALHRLVALQLKDGSDGSSRYQVIQRYWTHILAYAIMAGGLAAWCYWQLPTDLKWNLLVPNAIALAYVLPLLNGRRLRDLPYLKIFLIALAWAWITVVAPAQLLNVNWSSELLWMSVERAAFIFAITIPFDIRDMALDQAAAVGTLPGKLGLWRAQQVACLALLVMLLAIVANIWLGLYSIGVGVALLGSVGVSLLLVKGARPGRHDYYYTGLVDGIMLLQFVLVYLLG